MSVLPGEGSYLILYGSTSFAARTRTHHGYLARPDRAGAFPTVVVLGAVTFGTKEVCRHLARHGFAAAAMAGGREPGDISDLMKWISAPGTPWADPRRLGVAITGSDGVTPNAIAGARSIVFLDVAPELDTGGRPVLGLFGGAGDAARAARERREGIPSSRWALYPEAGTGFWDLESPQYHDGAASDALARMVAFFGETLGVSAAA